MLLWNYKLRQHVSMVYVAEMAKRQSKKMVNLRLDESLVKAIDEFRWNRRFPSRLAAIQHLLRTALGLTRPKEKAIANPGQRN